MLNSLGDTRLGSEVSFTSAASSFLLNNSKSSIFIFILCFFNLKRPFLIILLWLILYESSWDLWDSILYDLSDSITGVNKLVTPFERS